MRGTPKTISLPRRLICDLMRASMDVPFVSLSRPSISAPCWRPAPERWRPPAGPRCSSRPLPWSPGTSRSCAPSTPNGLGRCSTSCPIAWRSVAIARVEDGEECVMPQRIAAPEAMALAAVDAEIRRAKTAPIEDVPMFRKIMRATRLPLPLRRLCWAVGLNFGRQRGNWFGSFAVSSVAAYGGGELHPITPGPFIVSYGVVEARPDHPCRDPLGPPGHRRRPHRPGPDPAGTGPEH